MLRERLINLLTEAAIRAQKEGKLPTVVLPEITIEHPQNEEHGDYASNFPLKLARTARANPMVIANELVALLQAAEEIESAVAAPPGFINFTLRNEWLNRQVDRILQDGESFIDYTHVTIMDFEDIREKVSPWIALGVTYINHQITPYNIAQTLATYVAEGDLIIDLAWNIDCCEILQWCHDHGVLYMNTSVEVWDP